MHILVVEDEESTATVVRILLEQELEASVDIALDCASARELLSSNSYDLITLDYQLPDGDGLSLLQEIVARETAPPVVMVTGHGDEQIAVSAFKLGASGYVVKDTRMSTLLIEEVRSALARAGLEFERRQLLSIFDSIDESVYVSDPETYEVLYANRANRKVFGDIVGRKCYEALQGSSEPCQFCTNDRIFGEHDGEAYIWEFNNTLDGRWYRCIDRAIRWPNGEAVRCEMAIDITERKTADEALRRSESYHHALVEQAMDCITVLDEFGIITYESPSITPLLGYAQEELVGKSVFDYIHPEDVPAAVEAFAEGMRASEKSGSQMEVRFKHRDGSWRNFWGVGRNLLDEPSIHGVILNSRDITDREAAEEELRKSEELYRKLTEASPEAIFVNDFEGNVLALSMRTVEMFGYSQEDLSGKSAFDLVTEGYRDTVARNLVTLIETGRVTGSEMAIRKKDGSEVFTEVNASTIKDEHGNPSAIMVVVRDITERKAAEEALREAKERLELSVRGTGAGLWDWMVQTGEVVFNDRWAEIVGYALEELAPVSIDTWTGLCHPDDLRRSGELLERHFAGETEAYECEARMKHKNGEWVWVLDRGKVFEWADDRKPIRMVGTHMDITRRKRAEEALRRTQFTVDQSADSVFWLTSKGKIVYANEEACRRRGYTREEMLSLTIFDINDSLAADKDLWESCVQRIQREGHFDIEFRHRTKGGEVFPVEASLNFFEREDDWLFVGNVRDITERKEAEEALRQSEHQLSLMFENVAEVLFYLSVEPDGRYRFLAVNDAFLKVTGLLENQVVGKYVHEVIPEPSLTLVLAKYKQAIQDNTTVRWEEVTDYPAGRKYGDVAVTSTFDSSGCCTNLLGSVHDMTERKAAEEQLLRANEELKGYAHTVSHDLKGPLSAVAMAAEMLSSILEGDDGEALEGNAGEALRVIRESSRRAVHMTDNLLALAQAGEAPAKREPVDISGVVRSILQEKEALLEERGVRVSLDQDLGVAAMDPTHAYQVFSNLISNSIKYNDSENPEIHVSRLGDAGPGRLRYLVRDNGPGVPDGAEEEIFLPFHKGEGSTDTGIGLSIVDKVVSSYNGQVRAYNDGGACFEFTLPLYSS